MSKLEDIDHEVRGKQQKAKNNWKKKMKKFFLGYLLVLFVSTISASFSFTSIALHYENVLFNGDESEEV